ncbi:hypothetical protein HYX16_05530 [Candidatus Woesearchaeota archaeon]|nr:hypothetical protein [Candidatus Woesearchaeota archaeon]
MENKKKILAIIVIFLVAAGLFVYFYKYSKEPRSFNYHGFTVYEVMKDSYNIEVFFANDPEPHYLSTRYNPKDLEYIEIADSKLRDNLLKDEIFITMDPSNPNVTAKSVVALIEISKVTSNRFLFNIPTKGAFTEKKGENPVKYCKDVTKRTAIIWLKLTNQTRIYSDSGCVIIEGFNEDELIKAGTKLTLKLLGVMD